MSNSENNFWQEIQREISDNTEAKAVNLNMSGANTQAPQNNTIAQNAAEENRRNNMQNRPMFNNTAPTPQNMQPGQNSYEFVLDRPDSAPMYAPNDQDNILSILRNNIGYYVVCDFLIGTDRIETREGILYQSGVNFLTLYNPQYGTYTVCDIYSLKFITFYNTTTIPPERSGARNTNSSRNSSAAKVSGRRFY